MLRCALAKNNELAMNGSSVNVDVGLKLRSLFSARGLMPPYSFARSYFGPRWQSEKSGGSLYSNIDKNVTSWTLLY